MKHHERLQTKADNHRNMAALFAALAFIGGCLLGSAFRLDIHQAIMPGLILSSTGAVCCIAQLFRWTDTARSADLARIFDWEDSTR